MDNGQLDGNSLGGNDRARECVDMINLGNYLIGGLHSSSSWQWTRPATGTAPNASGVLDVLAPADPIWTGVPLTPGTPPTVDLHAMNAGHLDPGTGGFRSGITTVAAQSANNQQVAIAHAAPDAVRTGSQEQYFIASMTGGAVQAVPFTDAGKLAFLRAIDSLVDLPGPPVITSLSPAAAQTIVNHIHTAHARNSNFLLNVGPDPNGNIIPASVQRLAEIGALLRQQGN